MKTNWILILIVLLAAGANAQHKPGEGSVQSKSIPKTLQERESYAMGVEMLKNLNRQGFDFDLDMVIRGMKDAHGGGKLALTDEQRLELLNLSASDARVKRTSDLLVVGRDNKKAEEEFLAENKTKQGVVTLPNRLQYRVVKDSGGKKPSAEDTVQVNYRGTLLDGTQFEDTYKAGRSATISISDRHVIAGLREALKIMPVGARWQVFIPSSLAYGQRPAGKVIGPYSMLIYDIELLAIK